MRVASCVFGRNFPESNAVFAAFYLEGLGILLVGCRPSQVRVRVIQLFYIERNQSQGQWRPARSGHDVCVAPADGGRPGGAGARATCGESASRVVGPANAGREAAQGRDRVYVRHVRPEAGGRVHLWHG